MGLYVEFDPVSIGLPEYLEQEVDEEVISVEIDYADACDAFVETFLKISTKIVPVDTGFLRSTLSAQTDGWACEAWTDCEYAEYVEYGTRRQRPQPYFTPAFAEAFQAFLEEAQIAIEEASEMLEAEMMAVMAAMGEEAAEMGLESEAMGFLGGLLGLLLLIPFFILFYGIMNEIREGMGLGDFNIALQSLDLMPPEIELI